MKTIICSVCARGGSKGVPGKNLRKMLDVPLMHHTLLQAKAAGVFSTIVVSSDSDEILTCAAEIADIIPILRPVEMATDNAGKIPAIRHAMLEAEKHLGYECDISVDLDVTSPLRDPEDICNALEMLKDGVPNVITAMNCRRSPYFNLIEVGSDGQINVAKPTPSHVLRRQDAPQCYDMNASIYIWRRDVLVTESKLFLPGTALYVMPEERSWDIDSPIDWDVVELLMRQKQIRETL